MTDAAAIVLAGLSAAGPHYREAVAGAILGQQSDEAWFEFEKVLARTLIYMGLFGVASLYDEARANGVQIEPSVGRVSEERFIELPDFARGPGLVVGPFLGAVEAFAPRVPRLPETVYTLAQAARAVAAAIRTVEKGAVRDALAARSTAIQEALSRSFWVSDVTPSLIVSLKQLVADTIRLQSTPIRITLPDFISRARLMGAVNLTNSRLETIYRNALMQSYNDARAAIMMNDEKVRKAFPLAMIDEIGDRRTRGRPDGLYPDQGFHYQVDGYINTIEEINRQNLRPPNGHRCRGTLRMVSRIKANRMGLLNPDGTINLPAVAAYNGSRQDIIDAGQYPDPGWISAA